MKLNKIIFLKKLHEMVWRDGRIMLQDTLFDLQNLIDNELEEEVKDGYITLEKDEKGYIKKINDVVIVRRNG